HEYSSIEGVQEDVINIMLNLKGVALKMEDREEATLELVKKGPGVVTASDIQRDHSVEIVNPDHLICTITGDTELRVKLKV
ncbi:MAG TPA: DNA-directed RNA polymerase subunit alpha, partial [Alcanivorax sp.]|nr:DNA-directed RNA polymerase subunit alpha [Alcanivorax sp.]